MGVVEKRNDETNAKNIGREREKTEVITKNMRSIRDRTIVC